MTIQELQQDAIKRRKEVLDAILAEFKHFDINFKCESSKDYEIINFNVSSGCAHFNFRINLVKDELILNVFTNKHLMHTKEFGNNRYSLSMANIDELLMAIKSHEKTYIPKLQK
jgi:hypothetical protein